MDRKSVVPQPDIIEETKKLVELAARFQDARGSNRTTIQHEVSDRFNTLMGRMLDRFDSEVNNQMISPVFEKQYELSWREINDLPKGVIPLVIVREFVSRSKMVMDKDRIPNWSTFVRRYEAAL